MRIAKIRPRFTPEEIKALCFAVDVSIIMTTGGGGSVNQAVRNVDKKLQKLVDKIESEEDRGTEQ